VLSRRAPGQTLVSPAAVCDQAGRRRFGVRVRPGQLFVVVGFGLALAVGEAGQVFAQPVAAAPEDPYERFNRRIYEQSTGADTRFFLPVAKTYHRLTPGLIGKAIHNFLTNLSEPVIIANDILQARFKAAGHDFLRLTANSLAGIGGLIDVATPAGLPHHDNDFGITLGVWGVPAGPYLFLPLLGPSTVRDAIGRGVDIVADPLNFVRFPGRLTLQYSTTVVGAFDNRIRAQDDMDALLSGAADPYATLRSVYLQSREAQVRGEDAAPVLPDMDAPASPPAGQPAPGPSSRLDPPPPAAAPAEEALADPDRPIMTARPYDRQGAALLAALD
jgi:phospholipid-binding lipoprotein MlaA